MQSLYWRLRAYGNKWNERTGLRKYIARVYWALFTVLDIWQHPMARGRRLVVYRDITRWEIMRRVRPRPVSAGLSVGASILCPPWLGDSRYFIGLGYPDFDEFEFMTALLREGDLCVDIGASIGSYSLVAASLGAIVHAFEPASMANKIFTQAVEHNGYSDRVVVHSMAVSDESGNSAFSMPWASGNRLMSSTEAHDEGISYDVVEVRRLDDVNELPRSRGVTLLKVDAEGFDVKVLAGAKVFLANNDPVLIVEFWDGGKDVRAWLERAGYSLYAYSPTSNKLTEVVVHAGMSGNFIACTPTAKHVVDERLAGRPRAVLSAPKISWHV